MNLPISELEQCHPDYDPIVANGLCALQTYSDFYSGGRKFEAHKNKYLRSRPIETAQGANGAYRQGRLDCAYYTPHCGGIGDNLAGTALQYPPTIELKTTDEARASYYRGLNSNIDGLGGDSRSLAWCLLNSLIVHRRAYVAVNFPAGSDNARFTGLDAKDVDDWECDDGGELVWLRTHSIDTTRSKGPYSPKDTEKHTWTFYTATETTEYIATRPLGGIFPPEAVALGQEPVPHGLGVVPIFPIEVEENFWVMDRLFSTARAYFNREASRSFSIDTGALALPVIKTKLPISNIVTSSGFCIKIDPADDFFWRSPDGAIYAATQADCEYLLGNLYGALNQMALTAAGQSGNPRQSGTAKTADAAAIKAFLSLLCAPVMAGLRKALKAVQAFRDDDDLPVEIHGMTNFDVQSIELEINRCMIFTAIPGMPPTARKESMRRAIRAYLPDLDEDTIEDINEELDKIPEMPPPVAIGANSGAATVLNSTTGRPQGFAPGQVSQQFDHKLQPATGAA